MAEVFNLSLDQMLKFLGLKENFVRELANGIMPTLDVTQFISGTVAGITGKNPFGTLATFVGATVTGDSQALVVPPGAHWQLRGFNGVFQASATAGARRVGLQVRTGFGLAHYYLDNTDITAGQAWNIMFVPETGVFVVQGVAGSGFHQIPIGSPRMKAGWTVQTLTQGLLAGDGWTLPTTFFEEYLEASPPPASILAGAF